MGMNERIKLLAKLSGFKVDWQHEDVQALKMARFEKFAQLIVLECLALADNTRDGCEQDGEDQQALGADWVGLAIARHFGVEE